MTTIIVTNEANDIDEFTFEDELRTISLGRRTTNDVCIPELSVSGTHATISIIGGVATLTDLNSTNGTYVNGQVVQTTEISESDEIILGKVELKFSSALLTKPADDAHADSNASPKLAEGANETAKPDSDAAESYAAEAEHATEAEHTPAPTNASAQGDNSHAAAIAQTGVMAMGAKSKDNHNAEPPHPLDGLENVVIPDTAVDERPMHDLDSPASLSKGAVIEIKNGAKSGQILPIDKPVTTLGRPGIQIAAIMRKPDGYFLMHIESDDNINLPTLNRDAIGDEPVMLHSGDELTVAGIDVEFMLS